MAIIDKHISTAVELIAAYDFSLPFHLFLSKFFKKNKKIGSRDRKNIREACYCYFRFGNALPKLGIEEKIRLAFRSKGLIQSTDIPIKDEHFENIEQAILHSEHGFNDFFPCRMYFSKELDVIEYAKSVIQPGLVFFRKTKKGMAETIDLSVLSNAKEVADNTFSVGTATPLEQLINMGLIQVQDLSSQEICKHIEISGKCWDVCAGAGGKVLHLQERNSACQFYVSDVRRSILENLQERAANQGIDEFLAAEVNVAEHLQDITFQNKTKQITVSNPYFDTIVADVPCSGSGVWRRNPENILGFKCNKVEHYAGLQRSIVKHALPFLKKGCVLHYITCSVFEAENEGQFDYFNAMGLTVQEHKYYNTIQQGGDILFHATLIKNE